MAILDKILGRKEKKSAGKEERPKATRLSARQVKAEKLRRSPMAKSESRPQSASGKTLKKEVKTKKVLKKEENIAHRILLEPLITEKSSGLGQFNQYVFKVSQEASKGQIKGAVRDYYGVGVTGVNIIKIHSKKRIHGRTIGYKKGYKKAVVTLQQGDTIGIAEGV